MAGSLVHVPSLVQRSGELTGSWPEGQEKGTRAPYTQLAASSVAPGSERGRPQEMR